MTEDDTNCSKDKKSTQRLGRKILHMLQKEDPKVQQVGRVPHKQ
jgi:hypothetical protein